MIQTENPKTAYLGPVGTFSHQAALYYAAQEDIRAFSTIDEALFAVDQNLIHNAVVPLENTIEGTVNVTLDSLIFDTSLFIQSELVLPVEHHLLVNEKSRSGKITKILSHPQPFGQCRKYLSRSYPDTEMIPTSSTAEAARLVAASSEPWAAIGAALSASLYGLSIAEKVIPDTEENYTHFLLVSKKDTSGYITYNKTSLAFSTDNKPGSLYKILNIFDLWDINMTKILSRPMKLKNKTGQYVFYIDIEGSTNNMDMADALTMIKRKTNFFKMLGSYQVNRL